MISRYTIYLFLKTRWSRRRVVATTTHFVFFKKDYVVCEKDDRITNEV